MRPWVLSLPFELRQLAAFCADVARALGRIFIEAVALEQKHVAAIAGSQHAAIHPIQRFGGSLNLNLPFHAILADGVFAPDDPGAIRFHSLAPPTQDLLDRVVRRVRDRALRWLRKHGFIDERLAEERGNEQPDRGALEACADTALRGGAFAVLDQRGASRTGDADARFEPKKRGPFTAERDGFDLQAAVRIEADDDEGRERLVRYCARPCFALDRLTVLRDGRVAYRVKYARRGVTHRVMTPIELLARLAARVPPARYPLVRYHGVLAPHARWRSAVVPKPPAAARTPDHPACANAPARETTKAGPSPERLPKQDTPRPDASRTATPAHAAAAVSTPPWPAVAPTVPAPSAATTLAVPRAAAVVLGDVVLTDFGISVRHLDRLLGGLLLATAPRLEWAKLLRRTFGIDVLRCAQGGGRLRLLAAITDKATARTILEHVGLPAELAVAGRRDRDADLWADTPRAPE